MKMPPRLIPKAIPFFLVIGSFAKKCASPMVNSGLMQNRTEAVEALLCTTPTWNSIMLTGMQTVPRSRSQR